MGLAYPRALGPGVREVVGVHELEELGDDDGVALLRPLPPGRDVLVLHQRPPVTDDVLDEADRLSWLAGRAGAPEMLASGRADEGDEAVVVRLPSTAVAGTRGHPLGPERLAETLADTLRRLHELDVSSCPLEASLAVLRARVADRHRRGLLRPASDGPYAGRPVADLLSVLDGLLADLGEWPDGFIHAGLRADRLWFVPEAGLCLTGWRHGGVGDPHVDLAAAATLLVDLHGPALVGPFLDAYGLDRVDVRRLDVAQLLVHLLR